VALIGFPRFPARSVIAFYQAELSCFSDSTVTPSAMRLRRRETCIRPQEMGNAGMPQR
jgi:hypothetical protein